MDLQLKPAESKFAETPTFTITGSKSESNRLLILKALYPDLQISNLSNSDDTVHMQEALDTTKDLEINIGHAGTAMRFLTAYFACQENKGVILTGSKRMQQRPIKVLVEALRSIGAKIEYSKNDGYPPLKIYGGHISKNKVQIDATVSSQYITALMLIAPSLTQGLTIELKGQLTSRPYLKMTAKCLEAIGVNLEWLNNHSDKDKEPTEQIRISSQRKIDTTSFTVESDWSSAGYWYSWVALQEVGYQVQLSHYKKDSLQGDSKLQEFYEAFGVSTSFENSTITILKKSDKVAQKIVINLVNEPDQAQTIFGTCLALGVNAQLNGLHTLRIKETDRIEALKTVGLRFRESEITTTKDSITLTCKPLKTLEKAVVIDTYNDHRMAMAFAPLACKTELIIKDAGVVSKSYPEFWRDLNIVNVDITEI